MASAELSDLSFDQLEDELATLAAHLAAGMSRWLELVAEADRRGSWAESGQQSCAEWLAWRCSLMPRSAREHVRVARALGGLPLIRAAFARGELSYAKVRAITRIATPRNEAALVDLASNVTAAHLERTASSLRRVTSAEAGRQHDAAVLNVWWDDDGTLVVHGRLAPEDGALLMQALEAAKDRLRESGERGSAEPRPRVTNAEALAAVADASLGGEAVRTGGDRYQVVVHVDVDALTRDGEGEVSLAHGPAIAPETARRLACDASVVQVSERNGRAVRVGRKTRSIPPALRRALQARDVCCRFPGCTNRRFLHAHHVRHWARGGETNLDNLVMLCTRHHRLVHEGGYAIDESLSFYDRGGRHLPAAHPARRGSSARLPVREGVGPRTSRCGGYGRMDYSIAVGHLLRL